MALVYRRLQETRKRNTGLRIKSQSVEAVKKSKPESIEMPKQREPGKVSNLSSMDLGPGFEGNGLIGKNDHVQEFNKDDDEFIIGSEDETNQGDIQIDNDAEVLLIEVCSDDETKGQDFEIRTSGYDENLDNDDIDKMDTNGFIQ